jgi:hypothetical protein
MIPVLEIKEDDNELFKNDMIKSSISELRIIYAKNFTGLKTTTKLELTDFMMTTWVETFKKGEHSYKDEKACDDEAILSHGKDDTHSFLVNLENGGFLFEGSLKITQA